MDASAKPGRTIRFSAFEVDLDSRELFKNGKRVKLQGQPFELLAALLDRAGEVVTREELKQRVWPADTVVDFDHGLNRSINKVREALSDSADSPQLIETLPRRGYRFIGSIEQDSAEESPPADATLVALQVMREAAEQYEQARRPSRLKLIGVAIAAGGIAASFGFTIALHRPSGSVPLNLQQLTTNSTENPVWNAVVSPDGKYLAYGDTTGIQIRLIATGESHTVARPAALPAQDVWFPSAWFPDGTRILASSVHAMGQEQMLSGWTVPVMGGTAMLLRDNALVSSVSPDGSLIAFTTGTYMMSLQNAIYRRSKMHSEIWVMGPNGENARRVVAGDNVTYFGAVQWSPDGKRIAYRKLRFANKAFAEYSIESRALRGGRPSTILSDRVSYFYAGVSVDFGVAQDFCWPGDGRRMLFIVPEARPNSRYKNLWEIAVDPAKGEARGKPHRLTDLPAFEMDSLSATADGKRLIFETGTDESHAYVGRILPGGGLETPKMLTLDERYNTPHAWTADSKAVIFNSDRTGTFALYKQGLDQTEPELIPTGAENAFTPEVSPDRKWLIYATLPNLQFARDSDSIRLMQVPLSGGAPELILQSQATDITFGCAQRPGAVCVIGEIDYEARKEMLSSLDLATRARARLFELPLGDVPINWSISPDGSRLAMTGADPEGRIEIRSLAGKIEQTVEAKGWPKLRNLNWTADGKALLVSNSGLIGSPYGLIGSTLLRVDLQGHVRPLWETKGCRVSWGLPSPDGRYLALRGATSERNAWLLENY